MGLLDNFRNFFKSSNERTTSVMPKEDSFEKPMLATQIVNLVDKIKRINSFDSSIWNLSNVSSTELQRKSLAELEQIHSSLNARLSVLVKQSGKESPTREALEASKWTGRKPEHLTNHEFDRYQRDEGR